MTFQAMDPPEFSPPPDGPLEKPTATTDMPAHQPPEKETVDVLPRVAE